MSIIILQCDTSMCKLIQVPYGGNFHCKLQWVAKRLSSSSTQLCVTAAVVFTKGCMVRGIIDKASMEVRVPTLSCR